VNNLPRILEKIKRLAAACRAEIEASARPLDALPVQWVLPFFFVHPDHAADWWQGVRPEVWERIHGLKQEPERLIIPEAELQRTPFALSHAEMQQFRNGPLLRMLSLVDLRILRHRGGRLKRHVELDIREALEFEVFRRDPEIGALLSCMHAQLDRVDVPVVKGAGLNTLAEFAWVPGIPTKGKAADDRLSEEDRRLALFETLRSEGEKLAVGWLPGLTDPAAADAAVVAQIRDRAAGAHWSRAEFEDAIKAAAKWVHTLAKACVHTKEVAEEKHQLAKRAKDVEALKRPPKDNNPFHQEPMTRQQHELFTKNEFSAVELAFIAVAADVGPNLVTVNHVLATAEFRLARKLGQIGRGHQAVFDPEEVKDLDELILGEKGRAEGAMYRDVHRYLAKCALDILVLPGGKDRLNKAIAHGQDFALPD
jgi:hypothetical protein